MKAVKGYTKHDYIMICKEEGGEVFSFASIDEAAGYFSTRYNKDSPTSIGGEMNCKQENERQWRAERNRYPPLT